MKDKKPVVTGISGSLRRDSHTRKATRISLEGASAREADTRFIDLRDYDLEVYNPDESESTKAENMKKLIRETDSLILGTPMYHGSYSSPLKTAIDYCGFDEFEDTTVALLGVSGGSFPITALEHLRSVCRALNAWVMPYQAAVPNAGNHFENGGLVDNGFRDRLLKLGECAVEYSDISPDPKTFESTQNPA